MTILEDIKSLMKALGGYKKVGDELGVPVQTVFSWADRGAIPVIHWPKIIRMAKNEMVFGVSSDSLMLMHQPRSPS